MRVQKPLQAPHQVLICAPAMPTVVPYDDHLLHSKSIARSFNLWRRRGSARPPLRGNLQVVLSRAHHGAWSNSWGSVLSVRSR